MLEHKITPNKLSTTDENKDTDFATQKKAMLQYLQNNVATASMISDATNIPQKNICRYKRAFEKVGILWQVHRKICKATGFPAFYLTTNPSFRYGL